MLLLLLLLSCLLNIPLTEILFFATQLNTISSFTLPPSLPHSLSPLGMRDTHTCPHTHTCAHTNADRLSLIHTHTQLHALAVTLTHAHVLSLFSSDRLYLPNKCNGVLHFHPDFLISFYRFWLFQKKNFYKPCSSLLSSSF